MLSIGRIERDFDQPEAGLEERPSDRQDLVGPDAAENGDQGQGGEVAVVMAGCWHGVRIWMAWLVE